LAEGPAPASGQEGIRVSIKRSVRDENLFVVRRLEAGKSPPPGSTEGFLLLAEEDVMSADGLLMTEP
jgi:hypothetical protein